MKLFVLLFLLTIIGCSSGGSDTNVEPEPTPPTDGSGSNSDGGDGGAMPDSPMDSDNDGIIDSEDSCPNQGSDGLGLDNSGCQLMVPVPSRNTGAVQLAQQQTVSAFGGSWELSFYRNQAYNCGLSGNYSFLVVEPSASVGSDAPLWVYLHGGGVGYFNDQGEYPAIQGQTQETWNNEETFDDLWNGEVLGRILDSNNALVDNTLRRRIEEGYRLLVLSMCDHDLYSGVGSPYPNNPSGGQTNGLQATMSAVEYTAANYQTTHVFAHGTSAGAVGAYSLATSFAQEQTPLTAIVADSFIITPRQLSILDEYVGTAGYPFVTGFTAQGVIDKIGFFVDPEQPGYPEVKIDGGFNATPLLFLGGDADPFCAGNLAPIADAAAAGLNNCDWVFDGVRQSIANQANSPHQTSIIDGAGHTPSNDAGAANDIIDNFVSGVLAGNPAFPFGSN